jgi:hypothetical protein
VDLSEEVGPITEAVSTSGQPTVTGDARVGLTLTGDDSGVSTTPTDALRNYRWLRDGVAIPGATDLTYTATNDDAGSSLSFEVVATKAGYTDAAAVVSSALGPVDGGQITLPQPTVTGTPVVDGTLTASLPGGLAPPDATVTWTWSRGTTAVGTGATYQPTPQDVGFTLVVAATATREHFDTVTQAADATSPVTRATFESVPVGAITGTLKVGHVLTAGSGTITPTPDEVTYQWYSDGSPVDTATASTFELTGAQRHTSMTVRVTASRAGYDDASDLSDATADVATETAPDLTFSASQTTIRRGEATTLSWVTGDADTVTASDAWTGAQPTSGTSSQSPSELGASHYVLTAGNANGTTTAQVTITVVRPGHALTVRTPAGLHLAGTTTRVLGSGLEPGEEYTVRVAGTPVATGQASAAGTLSRTVTIPTREHDGLSAVTLHGSTDDRVGTTKLRVVVNKTLQLGLRKPVKRPRHRQWVTVGGLAAYEHVTLTFRGVQISSRTAHANAHGVYRAWFRVYRRQVSRTVTVTGAFVGRRATGTFVVRRR